MNLQTENMPANVMSIFSVSLMAAPWKLAETLYDGKAVIIDLSADFRFEDVELYEKTYIPHRAKELIPQAVFGLPELYRDKIKDSHLIGNPGCYPTSAILGLYPLLKEQMIVRRYFHRFQIGCERSRERSEDRQSVLRGIGRF